MDPLLIVDIGRQSLYITMLISAPMLLAGLVVGLLVGVFQAVTQIHEMTLTFIPKILAMIGVLFLLLPWMTITFVDYTIEVFNAIPTLIH